MTAALRRATARRRILPHDERGANTIEFVFIMPLVLAVIGLSLSVGWLVVQRSLLDRAAEVAARELTLGATRGQAVQAAVDGTPAISGMTVTITTRPVRGTAGPTPLTADSGTVARGQTFTVTATVDAPVIARPLAVVFSAVPDELGLAGLAQGSRQ